MFLATKNAEDNIFQKRGWFKLLGKLKDLTGQRFGRLVVTKFAGYKKTNNGRNKAIWTCNCDCGNEKEIQTSHLMDGRTKTCGECNATSTIIVKKCEIVLSVLYFQ